MIVILLKGSNKIIGFGDSFQEYGSSYLVEQGAGQQTYCSKQNVELAEYAGDFPFEDFEPYKYLLRHGRLVEDPDFVRPSVLSEYGVPQDVIDAIEKRGENRALEKLLEGLAETGYGEEQHGKY